MLNSAYFKVDILVLATLFCIYEKDHPLYEEIISGRFKRTEQGSENKIININLTDFLKRDKPEEHLSAELTYFIEPQSYTNESFHRRLTQKGSSYFVGGHTISLSNFIESIFCSIFDLQASSLDFWISDNDNGLNNFQEAENNLVHSKLEVGQDATLLWLNYIYIKDEYDKLSKENYREFVELSSPLDYMRDN